VTELSKKNLEAAGCVSGRQGGGSGFSRAGAAGVAVGNAWVPVVTPAAGRAGFAGLGLVGGKCYFGPTFGLPASEAQRFGPRLRYRRTRKRHVVEARFCSKKKC
jgi:hypothetical protein